MPARLVADWEVTDDDQLLWRVIITAVRGIEGVVLLCALEPIERNDDPDPGDTR